MSSLQEQITKFWDQYSATGKPSIDAASAAFTSQNLGVSSKEQPDIYLLAYEGVRARIRKMVRKSTMKMTDKLQAVFPTMRRLQHRYEVTRDGELLALTLLQQTHEERMQKAEQHEKASIGRLEAATEIRRMDELIMAGVITEEEFV